MKRAEQALAIELRRSGIGYQEIRSQLGIAKSTLWRWLKLAGMVEIQPQRLTELKRLAQRKAAKVNHDRRIERTQVIVEAAKKDIGLLTDRDLFMLGAALYWAEGSKQKPHNVSEKVIFTNSDPQAVKTMLLWLQRSCGVSLDDMIFEIYLHETAEAVRAQQFWSEQLDLPIERLQKIRWKRHKISTQRKNIGDTYYGLVRVKVRRSTDLNRKITGWITGICNSLGSGVMATRLALDQKTPGSTPGSPATPDRVMERLGRYATTGTRTNGRDYFSGG